LPRTDKIINTLEKDSLNLIDWFTSNQMKVNPDKFQAIAIGKNTQSKNISFNLNGFSLYINFSALSLFSIANWLQNKNAKLLGSS
jgi:hypothetical protein